MTVASVWGLIDGSEHIAVFQSGDTWVLGAVPAYKTGDVIVEVWAEDEAGNQTYRSGILTLDKGAVKCFRWVVEFGQCTMKPIGRTCEMHPFRPACRALWVGTMCEMHGFRPTCVMRPHVCPKGEC